MGFPEAWRALLTKKAIVMAQPQTEADLRALPDMIRQQLQNGSLLKSPSPTYLIRPPFGVPMSKNVQAIKQVSQNAYVFSATQTISDEIANTEWEIVQEEGFSVSDSALDEVHQFFDNPNGNDETFGQILRKTVPDILEVDAGVWIKAFNFEAFTPPVGRRPGQLKRGKMVQIFAKDGGTFLVNPDIFGYFGNRAEFVSPIFAIPSITKQSAQTLEDAIAGRLSADPGGQLQSLGGFERQYPQLHQLYSAHFLNRAAYFQYPNRNAQLPIPFGRREVVYMMRNPRTDSHYGRGAVEMLVDIIFTLIYGSKYNLDMYLNNNMPDGVLQIIGGMKGDIDRFRAQMTQNIRGKDAFGNLRKIFFKFPITTLETKWQPFTFTPREMEIIAQQSWFIKLLWACFGVNASEMGFTEDSNRATEHVQSQTVKRKVINPLLKLFQDYINMKIVPEFGVPGVKFMFRDFDLTEEHSKLDLMAKEVALGIRSRRDVAEEKGIDFDKQLKDMEADGDEIPSPEISESPLTGMDGQESGADGEEVAGSSHLEDLKGSPARWPSEPFYHDKVRAGRKAAATQPVNIAESDELGILIPFFRELDKKLELFFENIPEEADIDEEKPPK